MGGSGHALVVETLVMTGFLLVAVIGFKKSLWLVVAALAAHGVFDVFHGRVVANPGVPAWWAGVLLDLRRHSRCLPGVAAEAARPDLSSRSYSTITSTESAAATL